MQSKLWKEARRILAIFMALAMVVTNFSSIPVSADEGGENGAAKEETPTEWDFRGEDYNNQENYNGLIITGGVKHDATYGMRIGNGSIKVPVSGPCDVEVGVGYTWDISFNDSTESFVQATDGGHQTVTYSYIGEAGTVTIKAGSTYTSYIKTIKVVEKTGSSDTPDSEIPDSEVPTPDLSIPESVAGKIDVWDFAAEKLDESVYTNKLSVNVINSWYGDDVEAGIEGKALPAGIHKAGEVFLEMGGKTNNRIRTYNTAITRHDKKSLKIGDVTYNGYFYSNNSASSDVYLGINAKAGDILTFVVSSNGGKSTINFVNVANPNKILASDIYEPTDEANAKIMSFYAPEDGTYKVYSSDEKLVIARVYRESTNAVTVSGNVTAPVGLTDYSIAFTNQKTGAVTTTTVNNGTYSVTLNDQYKYDVSLVDANGYIISSATSMEVAKGSTTIDFPITIIEVTIVTVTGTITGLTAEELAKATISFETEETYKPELTFEGMNYSAKVEKGVTYNVVVKGINDYALKTPTTVSVTEETTVDMTFEKKPVYTVTIAPTGATLTDLAEATFIFTNLNEEEYVYTFTGTDNIKLRDGVYSVKVENSGIFVQQLTANLKVAGVAVEKTIGFESDITEWVFSDASFKSGAYANSGSYTYNGLSFSNGSNNKDYLLANAGTITIPVKGDCVVTVNACYEYSFYFTDNTEDSVGKKTGSTSQIDSFSYNYKGGEGTVTITVLGQSYITSIKLEESVAYKETLTVGTSGCDFTTINDALSAVRAMTRANNERVTIEIQPGDYEEMLVVDVPNVTLKNASVTPSLETKNKGVDIDANAVRITSYYGHGYTYYSMGNDCKYDEKILEVNKENGYPSFENPGTGTTAGSYWNATVVVTASGFEAEGIIFENSFNQYISKKAANDVVVAKSGAKEGSVKRADMKAGDTTVQNKEYVERAAALAIANNVKKASFDNCKFIGRQDTLYGGTGTTAAFYDCAIYGGTDYIFGGMTAVFAKCDLVFNTSEDKNDVGYITAAQTPANTRGLLLYNCTVTSTVPGVDTASEYKSKAGYLGRPWAANTAEAVFYNTIIEATDAHWYEDSASLIHPVGWSSSLSGESVMSAEYGTYEMAKDVDNQSKRVSWASTLTTPKLSDGTEISVETFLGDWDAFAGKDMTVVMPTDKVDNKPVEEPDTDESLIQKYVFDATKLTANADKEAVADGTTFADGYFKSVGTVTKRTNSDGTVKAAELDKASKGAIQFTVTSTADVTLSMSSTGGSNTSAVALVDNAGNVVTNNEGITTVTGTSETKMTYTGLAAGTYKVVSPESKEYGRGARVFSVVVDEVLTVVTEEYKLDATTLTAAADKEAIAEGTTFADGYFKSVGTVTKRTNSDGTVKAIEIDKALKGAILFSVTGQADVELSMSSTGGSNTSPVALVDEAGNVVANNEGITTVTGTSETKMTYTGLAAGTYKVVSPEMKEYGRGARLLSIVVEQTSSGSRPERADWATVAAPTIISVALSATNANQIIVKGTGVIGHNGADSISVDMMDSAGKVVETQSYGTDSTEYELTFTPAASGIYTFAVKAIRKGETDKAGVATKEFAFVLPLVAPNIKGAYNAGKGNVEVEWDAVKEATKYVVSAVGTDISVETTALTATLEGLEAGKTYTIKVEAVRGEESKSASIEKTVKDEVEIKWYFSAYGSSTNTKDNGYEVLADGSVRVYSKNGKGKIVPASTDGIAYYYTLINPDTTNFTLTATAVVNNWTLSNGQEGFGIMASDRVGTHGNSNAFWNNAYMAIASKVEYYYDDETNEVTDNSNYPKISMKLGVGSQEKVGVTAENLADFEGSNSTTAINQYFKTSTIPLETSCGKLGAGTYNIIGNHTEKVEETVEKTVTELTFTIQKNNTGYFVSYTDAEGNTTTQKYYDTEALSQIVDDSVAVGFFASRNADITFKDITFTTIVPEADAPAEERPIKKVTPLASILSGTVANSAEYELTYYANFDGTATITGASGVIVNNAAVEANKKYTVNVPLNFGDNNFTAVVTPNPDYVPGEYEVLSSYETISITHTVNYKAYGEAGETLYVAPNGSASGVGTETNPLDIYTAVKYAQPGQTIILKEGTYKLRSTVKVERGIDGTEENRINMIADPKASTRPVLDFQGVCAGMVLAGDYWYFQGFDVTNSANAQKGIQVSGSYNVLDQIHTYKNGNTGIQISRYLGTDEYKEWPAHNLILNCTSWENADSGREDADGFAAKLTVGDGNVFDGCIAHHNADDGWDLYAKVQTGSIGAVTIRNSVAYKNGYEFDKDGKEIVGVGNGNGFKMGGESMPGAHVLENSIAFNNKAKGIDSNSGPDIKVYNSIAFNNGKYNVALYTNTAGNTNYEASGIISFRTEGLEIVEDFKFKGAQDQNKVYGDTNYYWDTTKQISANKAGEEVKADWFKSLEFVGITRNEDGTINMNGFLELTENAKVNASIGGTASAVIVPGKTTDGIVKPSVDSSDDNLNDEDNGNDNSNDNANSDDSNSSDNNIVTDIIDTIVDAITGGNKDKNKDKEQVKIPEGTDNLVKDLVKEILAGKFEGTAVSKETASNIAEAIKAGKTIVTESVTTVLKESQVPVEEKEAIVSLVNSMTDKECGIAQYLDLSVLIGTSEGDTLGKYYETAKEIEFTVDIPSDMLVEGRTFFVVRIHNGVAEALETKDNGNGTLTFKTDKFSTYAIAYIDEVVEDLPVGEDVPKVEESTGDNVADDVVEREGGDMAVMAVIAILLLAIGSILIIKKKKASEQDSLN